MSSPSKALRPLTKLSNAVYLSEPPASTLANGTAACGSDKAPQLILISGWMGVSFIELCLRIA